MHAFENWHGTMSDISRLNVKFYGHKSDCHHTLDNSAFDNVGSQYKFVGKLNKYWFISNCKEFRTTLTAVCSSEYTVHIIPRNLPINKYVQHNCVPAINIEQFCWVTALTIFN